MAKARQVVVVQTTKLRMDREPRLGIPKKESQQDLVRCPAESLEITVYVLEESIVVAAKASPCYDEASRSGLSGLANSSDRRERPRRPHRLTVS